MKNIAERLASKSTHSLRTRIENLEKQAISTRLELNEIRARDSEFAKHCPSFSIIINTCNRRPFLEKAIESAWRQYYPSFEIICVNGPSTDGTHALLEAWKDRIKICHCPERNLSRSRNIGIAAAGGDLIAFMDDDAIAPQDWLMELVRGYSEASVGAVGGYVRDRTDVNWQAQVSVADRYGDVRHYPTVGAAVESEGDPEDWRTKKFFSPMGTNVSFRRSALNHVGGFDENYAYHLDETDVVLRLVDAGLDVRFQGSAEVTHKSAASELRREDRTPRSFYHQARSKTYFILRHAAPVFGRNAADKHISAYLAWLASLAKTAFRQGRLARADVERLQQELVDGRKAGEILASQGPKLAHFAENRPSRGNASPYVPGSFPRAETTPLLGQPV
ncbi:MAG: glycosyltransferase [Lachnospiraceae bacterium]|nr:glycosyltransferase [Lachnospiraceae bacterium]